MTVISIVLAWLVVGFLVALGFGLTARYAQRGREDHEAPQQQGADIRFWRSAKDVRCQIVSGMTATTASRMTRKHGARHHIA